METKSRFILWLERARDYWFPTLAQIQAAEKAKLPVKQIRQDTMTTGFGKTQDEIDADLERLDAGLEKITWDKELDDRQ